MITRRQRCVLSARAGVALALAVALVVVAGVARAQTSPTPTPTPFPPPDVVLPQFAPLVEPIAAMFNRTVLDTQTALLRSGRCVPFNRTLTPDCTLLDAHHNLTLYRNDELGWTQEYFHNALFANGTVGFGAALKLLSVVEFPCRRGATGAFCAMYPGCSSLELLPGVAISVPVTACRTHCESYSAACADDPLINAPELTLLRFNCSDDALFADPPACNGRAWLPLNTSDYLARPPWCGYGTAPNTPYEACSLDCRGNQYGLPRSVNEATRTLCVVLSWVNLVLLPFFILFINAGHLSLTTVFKRLISALASSVIAVSFGGVWTGFLWDDMHCTADNNSASPYSVPMCGVATFFVLWGTYWLMWALATLLFTMALTLHPATSSAVRRGTGRRVLQIAGPLFACVLCFGQSLGVTADDHGLCGVAPIAFMDTEPAFDMLLVNLCLTAAVLMPALVVVLYHMISVTIASKRGGVTVRRSQLVSRLVPPALLAAYSLVAYLTWVVSTLYTLTYVNDTDTYYDDVLRDLLNEVFTGTFVHTGQDWHTPVVVSFVMVLLSGPVFLAVYTRQIVKVLGALRRGESLATFHSQTTAHGSAARRSKSAKSATASASVSRSRSRGDQSRSRSTTASDE